MAVVPFTDAPRGTGKVLDPIQTKGAGRAYSAVRERLRRKLGKDR